MNTLFGPMLIRICFVSAVVAAAACAPPSDPDPAQLATAQASLLAGESTLPAYGGDLYVAGAQFVNDCANSDLGPNPSPESCYYWHRMKLSGSGACTSGRCDKLVIYFSGGDQTCSLPNQPFVNDPPYGGLAKSYADAGFVFVCANLFAIPFTLAAAQMPYSYEATRVRTLVNAIVSSPTIAARWSGRELLFSGVSHGSTAPVLAMARFHFDRDTRWQGQHKTAACFMDGQYDVYFNQRFWTAPEHLQSCALFDVRTVCYRYLGQLVCAPDTRAIGMDIDSIVAADPTLPPSQSSRIWKSVTAADFAITKWKLVECGSNLPATEACNGGDMLPAPPIATLCNMFNVANSGHHCDPGSYPLNNHLECGVAGIADGECLSWFDELPDTQ